MSNLLDVVHLCTAIMLGFAMVRFIGSRKVAGAERELLVAKARVYLISAGVMGLIGVAGRALLDRSPDAAPAPISRGDSSASPVAPVSADAAPAGTAQNAWTLVPGRGAIGIGPEVSHAILRGRLGDSLVVAQRLDGGSGRTVPGTVLFPLDPMQRLEVLWQDTIRLERPATLRVRGTVSRWRVHPGTTLGSPGPDGSPLRELTVSLVP